MAKIDLIDIFNTAKKNAEHSLKVVNEHLSTTFIVDSYKMPDAGEAPTHDRLFEAFPTYVSKNCWQYVDQKNWTFGNWAAILWLISFLETKINTKKPAGDIDWGQEAFKWTTLLNFPIGDSHALYSNATQGQIYRSYGLGYSIDKVHAADFKPALTDAFKRYMDKYDTKHGYFFSGMSYRNCNPEFPVVIDQLLSLEFPVQYHRLFSADACVITKAITHLTNTFDSHIWIWKSENGVLYPVAHHLLDIDDVPPRQAYGNQGYGPSTAWARGQAWVVEGFASLYASLSKSDRMRIDTLRETVHQVVKFMNVRTKNFTEVPIWDVLIDEHRSGVEESWTYPDASAAAALASGLFTLSFFDGKYSEEYLGYANQILETLTKKDSGFFNVDRKKRGILHQSCYKNPYCEQVRPKKKKNKYHREPTTSSCLDEISDKPGKGEAPNNPLIYGDFYFLKSLVSAYLIEKKDYASNPFGYHLS